MQRTAYSLATKPCLHDGPVIPFEQTRDIFQVMLESLDLSEQDDYGWSLLYLLRDHEYISIRLCEKTSLFIWIMKLLSFEINLYGNNGLYALLLRWFLECSSCQAHEFSNLLFNLRGDKLIDAIPSPIPHPEIDLPVLLYIAWGLTLSRILPRNPDLFRLGHDRRLSPKIESPTSLA